MKQAQWIVAAVVLAAMVFVISFAMQYLGGISTPRTVDAPSVEGRELQFASRVFPPDGLSFLEREDKTTGHIDFWFQNPHPEMVKLGLFRKGCKCTAVEGFVLDSKTQPLLAAELATLCGMATAGPLAAAAYHGWALPAIQSRCQGKELLHDSTDTFVEVPGSGVGFLRLQFTGERTGRQGLDARVWMDSKDTGKIATFEVRVVYYEPFRTKPIVQIGTFRDEQLSNGVTGHLICWSSTRPQLDLEARTIPVRNSPGSDPFVLGKPERLGPRETQQVEKDINDPQSDLHDMLGGQVLCAYRIPYTLRAIAPDGKTPIDVGPLRRRVLLTCRDTRLERSVILQGRVRGVVDLGTEDEAGEINFRSFRSSMGRREQLGLHSVVPNIELKVDEKRTWEFLKVSLQPRKTPGSGQSWILRVEVKPNTASGPFPRREDPLYEDCAVYLVAHIPGQTPRPIRIAVQGTASEG